MRYSVLLWGVIALTNLGARGFADEIIPVQSWVVANGWGDVVRFGRQATPNDNG